MTWRRRSARWNGTDRTSQTEAPATIREVPGEEVGSEDRGSSGEPASDEGGDRQSSFFLFDFVFVFVSLSPCQLVFPVSFMYSAFHEPRV